MAYEKKTQSILAGSVNILPPGDLIPEEDALVIRNFRSNTAGSLRSRAGMVSLVTGLAAAPDSMLTGDGRRYVSAGGSLYCNGSSIASGFGGVYPLGMVSFQGFLWATSPSKSGKHDGTVFTPMGIVAPTAAATALAVAPTGTGRTGTYLYYVTFVDEHGYESGPNPSASVTLAAQAASLTGIPIYSGPAGVTIFRRIYRAGGAQKNALRIAELADNSTTTYDDEMSDVAAEEAGLLFDAINNNVPPNSIGVVGPYYDRLLYFSTPAHPSRVWYSKQLQPYAVPGSDPLDTAGNFFDVGQKGEAVLAISIRPRQIVIYKERSIWRVAGDPGAIDGTLEQITDSQGIVGRKALASGEGYDFFLSPEGLMSFDGETPKKISLKMDPFFLGEYPDNYNSSLGTPFFTPRRSQVCMAFRRGQLWISLPTDDVAINDATVKLNVTNQKWVQDSRGFTALYDEGQNGDFLGGTPAGVMAVEDNVTDAGVAIPLTYEGHFSNQGAPENEKMYADLVIEANTNGANLTVSAMTNNGQTVTALGFFSTLQRQTTTFPIDLRGFNCAAKITGTVNTTGAVNGDVHIYKATLHYYVLAHRAKTYDSDLTDLGTREIKSCDFLELDIEVIDAAGGGSLVTYKISTDRPAVTGGGLTIRQTGTFGQTSRTVLRFPFAEFEGQMFRLQIIADPNTTFLLYSAALRVRPIGAYVDGQNGESYKTKEVGVGI